MKDNKKDKTKVVERLKDRINIMSLGERLEAILFLHDINNLPNKITKNSLKDIISLFKHNINIHFTSVNNKILIAKGILAEKAGIDPEIYKEVSQYLDLIIEMNKQIEI